VIRRLWLPAAALLATGLGVVRLAAGAAPATPPATPPAAPSARPPAVARMICAAEVRGDVAEALRLPAAPPTSSTWDGATFTCTYRLPAGPMVLSVHESPDPAAALAHLAALRVRLPSTTDAPGLTPGAFRTNTGTVALAKDRDTLLVDTTGLPAQFGPQRQKRTDLAYEVASVVLGCWTGDE
jgi:hypothetical protein